MKRNETERKETRGKQKKKGTKRKMNETKRKKKTTIGLERVATTRTPQLGAKQRCLRFGPTFDTLVQKLSKS